MEDRKGSDTAITVQRGFEAGWREASLLAAMYERIWSTGRGGRQAMVAVGNELDDSSAGKRQVSELKEGRLAG